MSEYRKVHDPFLNKDVLVSDKLTDRLRGKYASGPHLPNGNPEFGWRQFQAPPIQHEAAAEIERLEAQLASARKALRSALTIAEVEWQFRGAHPYRQAVLEQMQSALTDEQGKS